MRHLGAQEQLFDEQEHVEDEGLLKTIVDEVTCRYPLRRAQLCCTDVAYRGTPRAVLTCGMLLAGQPHSRRRVDL
eukprot:2886426-Rhodomonas_salina.2